MNKEHVDLKMRNISFWLGNRKVRVHQNLGVSNQMVNLTKRILQTRNKICSLPDNKSIVVYTDDIHIYYLMQYTNIEQKKIIGFIDRLSNKNICSPYTKRQYSVWNLEDDQWKNADCILIKSKDEIEYQRIKEAGYVGEIISIYDEYPFIPFFCIYENCVGEQLREKNIYADNILGNVITQAPTYLFNMIEKIDEINSVLEACGNDRILIYCVGGHTDCLFEYTDIKYKNVVAFADRGMRTYHNIAVRDVSIESFQDIDRIIISSYWYQPEIEEYLNNLGLSDKIVKLYSAKDYSAFYELPNICAPDTPLYGCSSNGMTQADLYAAMEESADKMSRNSNYLVTYNMMKNQIIDTGILYNKNEKEIIAEKNYVTENKKTAVIIQGPVVYDDDFTFRTIRYYNIIFPETKIILSTWESEDENPQFERFRQLDCEIVLSSEPVTKGVLNINYQVKSTHAGLVRAKELGYEYALKTRTDFRIYADDCLSYLCTLSDAFPSKGKSKKRIVTLQPILDVGYYIPDFILFGDVDDMLMFWDDELYPNQSGGNNPEMLMYMRYFKKIGSVVENPTENLKEYIDMLCKELIIVDPSTFKYFWKKYSYEGSIMYQESKNILTAADWFKRQFNYGKV